MPDVLKLTDQDHDLAVLVTNTNEDPTPFVTFMDAKTGQQVSMTIDVLDVAVRAVYSAVSRLHEITEEMESRDDEPVVASKLN